MDFRCNIVHTIRVHIYHLQYESYSLIIPSHGPYHLQVIMIRSLTRDAYTMVLTKAGWVSHTFICLPIQSIILKSL
jgi:hypothetical protein